MNKKILLITTFFYPQNRIPVLRVGQWAKYFANMGHEVTVLTTKKYNFDGPFGLEENLPNNVKIIEIDYLPFFLKKRLDKKEDSNSNHIAQSSSKISNIKYIVRNFRNYIGSLLNIYDLWIKKSYEQAKILMKDNKYDMVISSYSPPAVHKVAHKLKEEFPETKWIADFRDLWAYNHIYRAKGLFGIYEKYIEKKIISNVDIILTVSEPLTMEMKNYYPSKKIFTIENGFDPDEFKNWEKEIKEQPNIKNKLNIVYAGTIYKEKRDPIPLFEAVNELIEENIINQFQIEINFYGNSTLELNRIIKSNNYNRYNVINVKGFISRKESLQVQKNADLLLLLEWNDPSAKGVLTGKLFEYLVSGKPIFAVGISNNNAAGKVIEDTKTGVVLSTKDEIKKILKNIFNRQCIVFYTPNKEKIKNYSRDKQVKRIIELYMEN